MSTIDKIIFTDEDENKSHTQQPPPALDPSSELFMRGHHVFMSDVTQESMKPLIDWIISENFNKEKKKKELTLGICSPGGELNACFALVDVMKGSKIPIRTIGMGMIASCGLLMFISGERAGESSHRTLQYYLTNIHGAHTEKNTNYLLK